MGLERLQVVHMHYCKGQEPAVIFVLMAEEEMYIYVVCLVWGARDSD